MHRKKSIFNKSVSYSNNKICSCKKIKYSADQCQMFKILICAIQSSTIIMEKMCNLLKVMHSLNLFLQINKIIIRDICKILQIHTWYWIQNGTKTKTEKCVINSRIKFVSLDKWIQSTWNEKYLRYIRYSIQKNTTTNNLIFNI